ncbi:TniQ family protein [Oceanicaulis sp.]|uniref:TniQ family protein n=1 Tax=Oceanicaulis sp. TaxID=1924941 RepID=UPI003BA9D27D
MTIHNINPLNELPVRRWPEASLSEEPIYGWISRLAEANYAFSTVTFLQSLGLGGIDWDYDEQLGFAQGLPIQGLSELAHFTPKKIDGGYEIAGERLASRQILKGARRVCPACLAESRHVRSWWDIVAVQACPDHNTLLIDSLPDDPLAWSEPVIGMTRAGVRIGLEHAIDHPASLLDRTIVDRIRGVPDGDEGSQEFEPLEDLLQAASVLSRMLSATEPKPANPTEIRRTAQTGYDILTKGPATIISTLRGADWLQPDSDKERYDARCHYLPQLLATVKSPQLRALLSDAFGEARIANGLATPSGKLARYDGADGFWTLSSAAAQLQLETKYLKKAMAAAGVSSDRCPNTRAHRLSDQDLVQVRIHLEGLLSTQDVGSRLGCSTEEVEDLVNRRTLQMELRRGECRYFTFEALTAFVEKALDVRKTNLEPYGISLADFANQASIQRSEAYSMLIRNQKIGVLEYDADKQFFDGLKVAYFRNTRLRPGAQVRDALTRAQVKSRLGVSSEGLAELIALGFLRERIDGNDLPRIDQESLDRFEANYVRASMCAPVLGCTPRAAMKRLRERGVSAINSYGPGTVCYVSKVEVHEKVGVQVDGHAHDERLTSLRDALQSHLVTRHIPATVRLTCEPTLVVEATSRKWSFDIRAIAREETVKLRARFRQGKEDRRLREIRDQQIEPENIWPGAEVESRSGDGFELQEAAPLPGDKDSKEALALLDLVARRALELHEIL